MQNKSSAPLNQRVSVRISDQIAVGIFAAEKKHVSATVLHLPANGHIGNDGTPVPDPKVLSHVKSKLVRPIFELLAEYKEILGVRAPHVQLDFSQTDSASGTSVEAEEGDNAAGAQSSAAANAYLVEMPRWSLDKVILPPSTRLQLEVVLNLIKHHELMFEQWNLRSIMRSTATTLTLNFYGPSGTGKTLAAHAVAHALGKKVLVVNYAELESKFVGEMNKNIHKVFAIARANDAVLFFDEADSVLGNRLSHVSQAADHGVNMARSVMLIELERFPGIAIFASNFVRNYDSAFARRLLHHVRFDLPDLECRRQIFETHLPSQLPIEAELACAWLAALTDGFSGGEIRNVVLKAAAYAAAEPLANSAKKVTKLMFEKAIREVQEARLAIAKTDEGRRLLPSLFAETQSAD